MITTSLFLYGLQYRRIYIHGISMILILTCVVTNNYTVVGISIINKEGNSDRIYIWLNEIIELGLLISTKHMFFLGLEGGYN